MKDLGPMDLQLISEARRVRALSYSPYSKFAVGAALLDSEGTVHVGCNVENASFGLTICAERSALVAAVAKGAHRFQAIAIAAPGDEPMAWPCGACRQVLSEFGMDLRVLIVGEGESILQGTLRELLPYHFEFPGQGGAARGGRGFGGSGMGGGA